MATLNQWAVTVKPSPTIAMHKRVVDMKEKDPNIKVYDFGVGEMNPAIPVPQILKDEVIKAVNNDETHYVNSMGDKELLNALSVDFAKNFQLQYSPHQFVICPGPKDAVFKACMTILEPTAKRNQTVVFNPIYEAFDNIPFMLTGKQPIILDTNENFLPDLVKFRSVLEENKDIIALIIINSPNNPTGVVYPPELIKEMAEIISKYPHITVIFDEVYRTITYDKPFTNIATYLPNQTLVVGGMSKEVAGTGLRVGYVGGPEEIIRVINNVQGNSSSCVALPMQKAYARFLAADSDMKIRQSICKELKDRRDHMINKMKEKNLLSYFKINNPDGAFYLFPNVEHFYGKIKPDGTKIGNSDEEVANFLLDAEKVVTIPGSAFGKPNHLRIAYARSFELITAGVEAIAAAVGKLK